MKANHNNALLAVRKSLAVFNNVKIQKWKLIAIV